MLGSYQHQQRICCTNGSPNPTYGRRGDSSNNLRSSCYSLPGVLHVRTSTTTQQRFVFPKPKVVTVHRWGDPRGHFLLPSIVMFLQICSKFCYTFILSVFTRNTVHSMYGKLDKLTQRLCTSSHICNVTGKIYCNS